MSPTASSTIGSDGRKFDWLAQQGSCDFFDVLHIHSVELAARLPRLAELVPRVRPGGLLIVDNVLWHGQVVDPPADDPKAQAMAWFNDEIAGDDRVELVVLPISDGMTIAYRR